MRGSKETLSIGLLTAVALVTRLIHLTRHEIWVDEAATWWFARLTAAGRVAEQAALEPTPPLYYGLVGVLMRLFGESDFVMRLPSVLIGAATLPAVYLLGRELFDGRVGLVAAAVFAVHPLHLFYSREARVYPLLLLLTVLLLWTLWRALQADGWRTWWPFGAVLLTACYSHFYGLFLGFTSGVLILTLGRDWKQRARGLAIAALAGALFSPYLLMTLPHLKQSGAAWSVEAFYERLPEEKALPRVLEMQLIGAGYHGFMRQIGTPPTPPVLRGVALAAQIALIVAALSLAIGAGRRRQVILLVIGWLVPILVPWGITHWGRAIFHSGRHDFYTLGSMAVLVAAGGVALLDARRPSRPVRNAIVGLLALAIVAGAGHRLYWLHRLPAPTPNRDAGRWIAERAGPTDLVIATGIRRLVTEHYTRLGGSDVPFRSFPISTDDHPGWSDTSTLVKDQAALTAEARATVAELTRAAAGAEGPRQVFVAVRPYERRPNRTSASWMVDGHLLVSLQEAGWRFREDREGRALLIAVYEPPP